MAVADLSTGAQPMALHVLFLKVSIFAVMQTSTFSPRSECFQILVEFWLGQNTGHADKGSFSKQVSKSQLCKSTKHSLISRDFRMVFGFVVAAPRRILVLRQFFVLVLLKTTMKTFRYMFCQTFMRHKGKSPIVFQCPGCCKSLPT